MRTPASARDIDVLAAGSLIPLKRYDLFVEVVAEIKKEIRNVKATLAGDGPERKKLESLIEKSGLGNNILMTGELPHSQVLRLMQRTKVFLHPSSYEGFGVVCLEALYAGAHVISFCKPMKKEILHWNTVNDKEQMVCKTLEMLQNPKSDHSAVAPYLMSESVKAIAEIFNFGDRSPATV